MDEQEVIEEKVNEPKRQDRKNKFEVINEFIKLLKKNQFVIKQEKLEALFLEMQEDGMPSMSLSLVALDPTKRKQKIKIFPKKEVFIEKYQKKFSFDDKFFQEVHENFYRESLFKPFMDEQHQLGIKFAGITNVYIESDGLYIELELNELGYDAIKNNKYSYISPQWGQRTDTDGKTYKNVLMAVTLTNIPALEGEIPTLQDQIQLEKNLTVKEKKMDKEVLKKAFELSTKIDGFKLEGEMDPDMIKTVITDAITLIDGLKEQLSALVVENEEMKEKVEEQAGEMSKIKKSVEEKETNDFFEKAVELGKIEVKDVEEFKKLYALDKVAVKKIIDSKKENDMKQLSSSFANDNKLEAIDIAIMKERGLNSNSKEDVDKYLSWN
jgi:hypothetical protein